MTTKKLKKQIEESLKIAENYLEEANNEINESGDTDYDTEFLEKTIVFYKDMIREIEYRDKKLR